MKKYRIGKTYNLTKQHNRETWEKIKTGLEKSIVINHDALISLCTNHNHPAGGKGFVDYCIKNDWLSEVKS